MVIAISLVVVLAILNILTISLIHLARKDALKRGLAKRQVQNRLDDSLAEIERLRKVTKHFRDLAWDETKAKWGLERDVAELQVQIENQKAEINHWQREYFMYKIKVCKTCKSCNCDLN